MNRPSEPQGPLLATYSTPQLLSVLDAMTDGVWVCDPEPRLLYVNSACEQLNNIRREEVCGRLVSELLNMGNFDHDVSSLVLQTRQATAISQRVRSGRTLLVQGVPVFDDEGKLIYVVGTERDMTELNLLRGELEESRTIIQKMRSELLEFRLKEFGLADLVADSEQMQRVIELALRVADFEATVLLTGPTGTGKSMLARGIHQASKRKDKPFLSINCGAIPVNLLEAELFGYVAGAFTGADRRGKPGLVEAADGGTLFLDEIGELPLEIQPKLLRLLQERTYERVGDATEREADVRVIAATNRDLERQVAEGRFRQDLFERLNFVRIHVPPLRERREDIPLLLRHCLDRQGAGRWVELTADAERFLCEADVDWSGNVRHLDQLATRVVEAVGSVDALDVARLVVAVDFEVIDDRDDDALVVADRDRTALRERTGLLVGQRKRDRNRPGVVLARNLDLLLLEDLVPDRFTHRAFERRQRAVGDSVDGREIGAGHRDARQCLAFCEECGPLRQRDGPIDGCVEAAVDRDEIGLCCE